MLAWGEGGVCGGGGGGQNPSYKLEGTKFTFVITSLYINILQ